MWIRFRSNARPLALLALLCVAVCSDSNAAADGGEGAWGESREARELAVGPVEGAVGGADRHLLQVVSGKSLIERSRRYGGGVSGGGGGGGGGGARSRVSLASWSAANQDRRATSTRANSFMSSLSSQLSAKGTATGGLKPVARPRTGMQQQALRTGGMWQQLAKKKGLEDMRRGEKKEEEGEEGEGSGAGQKQGSSSSSSRRRGGRRRRSSGKGKSGKDKDSAKGEDKNSAEDAAAEGGAKRARSGSAGGTHSGDWPGSANAATAKYAQNEARGRQRGKAKSMWKDIVLKKNPSKMDEEVELTGRAESCDTGKWRGRGCPDGTHCVRGQCLCPILPSNQWFTQICRRPPAAGEAEWCIMSLLDFIPSKSVARQARRAHWFLRGAEGRPNVDLPKLGDFSTCAVVGSSSVLKDRKWGGDIDNHTAVWRFNNAPTKGFESLVGRRTTVRLQNVEYCGFRESSREVLISYSMDLRGRCKKKGIRKMSFPFQHYQNQYFNQFSYARKKGHKVDGLPAKDPSGGDKKLSGGFFGIALAMHMCGSVTLYGFTGTTSHYFPKIKSKNHVFSDRHNWKYEKECIKMLSEGLWPGVRMVK